MTPAHNARQHTEHVQAAGGGRQQIAVLVPWYDRHLGPHCTHGRHVARHAHAVYREPVSERRAMLEAVKRIVIRDDHRRKP